jgi:proline dehydrogenase
VRTFLLYLSHKESFKNFMLRFKIFRVTAWRFVAGEKIDDAIRAARELNLQGIKATMDLLGENTRSGEDALRAADEIIGMLDRLRAEGVDCNVSVKLTQLGLDLGSDFCLENLTRIVRHAAGLDGFVRVDMEDSGYTQRTIDLVLRVHKDMPNVGVVIQSYLYRSENDVRLLLQNRVRIRLCKGAYMEPAAVAFRKKSDTDANYVKLMKLLLERGSRHAIATHDEAMIAATRQFAAGKDIPRERFEFQMLYGIRRDLQQRLAKEGYPVRVYIPFGKRWYPYFMRRLAERPANILFIARNLLRK